MHHGADQSSHALNGKRSSAKIWNLVANKKVTVTLNELSVADYLTVISTRSSVVAVIADRTA